MLNNNRADALINNSGKKPEFFSDFSTNFAKTPVGDQLSRAINERAVNQSLRNLILTNLGERLFQPNVGSGLYSMLFEPNFSDSLNSVRFFIQNTIENNEPRVNLLDVRVVSSENDQEIIINIFYSLINNPEPITFSFILKRVR